MADTPKLLLLNSTTEVPPGRYRYYQHETKRSFGPFGTLRQLVAEVKKHRKSNQIPIGTAFIEELQDWLCRHMESAHVYCHEAGREPRSWGNDHSGAAPGPRGTGYDGSAKWKQLHVYALVERPRPQDRAVWLSEFAQSLPCGECKSGWKSLVKANPLPLDAAPEEFFRWTVARHNDVNRKLEKEQMTLDAARALWSH